MRTTRALALASSLALLGGALAAPVAADAPDHPGCWGVASAELAQDGGMGEHSSQQSEPRAGLGNVAKALTESGNPQDLAPILLGDPTYCD